MINAFAQFGGEREWVVVQKLQDLIARTPTPQVVNLSAGSYTRNDWMPLSFLNFNKNVTAARTISLVAAAGNDGIARKFWPAAFDWAVGVGALGPDLVNRAWFSNYGSWVDVFTLGEGLVNAFATGEYSYHEPPKRPAVQVFNGRARWSGTSFAAPLVAGLIANFMSANGGTGAAAISTLLRQATATLKVGDLDPVPVLLPRA
jgi:subtilisin family serine protease